MSLNLSQPYHPADPGWARGRDWQECETASSRRGTPATASGVHPPPAPPAPPARPLSRDPGVGGGWWSWRRVCRVGAKGAPAAAPIGCAAAPSPRRAPPARSPGAGSRWRENVRGRDRSPRPAPDLGRAGIKPGRRRPGTRALQPPVRGEAGPGPTRSPRLRPLDQAPGARRPARGHATARAPRRYLQQSNEESRGEATAAGRDVPCARGCCRRCGCLKLPKVASQREAAARRELKGKERVRCRSDRQTDAQTCRRHHRRRPISGAREASQLRELLSGRVAC